jgi:hypothetical protein
MLHDTQPGGGITEYDRGPVARVEGRQEDTPPVTGSGIAAHKEQGKQGAKQEEDQQSRKKAKRTPSVESPYTYSAFPVPFFHEQTGNEKAAQNKKAVDAQEAAASEWQARVMRYHK